MPYMPGVCSGAAQVAGLRQSRTATSNDAPTNPGTASGRIVDLAPRHHPRAPLATLCHSEGEPPPVLECGVCLTITYAYACSWKPARPLLSDKGAGDRAYGQVGQPPGSVGMSAGAGMFRLGTWDRRDSRRSWGLSQSGGDGSPVCRPARGSASSPGACTAGRRHKTSMAWAQRPPTPSLGGTCRPCWSQGSRTVHRR